MAGIAAAMGEDGTEKSRETRRKGGLFAAELQRPGAGFADHGGKATESLSKQAVLGQLLGFGQAQRGQRDHHQFGPAFAQKRGVDAALRRVLAEDGDVGHVEPRHQIGHKSGVVPRQAALSEIERGMAPARSAAESGLAFVGLHARGREAQHIFTKGREKPTADLPRQPGFKLDDAQPGLLRGRARRGQIGFQHQAPWAGLRWPAVKAPRPASRLAVRARIWVAILSP